MGVMGGTEPASFWKRVLGVNSLAALSNRSMYKAPGGNNGQGAKRHGKNGKELRILVPPGTTVIDAENHFVIKDLKQPGDEFVIAKGGRGGKGNAAFKSSTNRSPYECTDGDLGEQRFLILELRSIADVGLVGKPNAGKSTLLSRISSARPEIADYPFTTKHPNLGIVEVGERSFVLADIPGLIEGASEGVGLGHEFLRHVERAGLLVHLVEPDPVDDTDPIENYLSIRDELKQYDQSLADRDEIVVVTKCEMESASDVKDSLEERSGKTVFMISAVAGHGLAELLGEIIRRVEERREAMIESGEEITPLREADIGVRNVGRKKRVPPHLAGPTAGLTDQQQAKDVSP